MIATHLTPDELAARLSGDARTLANWRVNGFGPRYMRVGERHIRYRLIDIEDWEASRVFKSYGDELASGLEKCAA